MTKPINQRTYKKNLESARGASSEHTMKAKNRRAAIRHAERVRVKREAGEARNKLWRQLTPEEQLRDLDHRLGTGRGAARQRKKIKEKLANE